VLATAKTPEGDQFIIYIMIENWVTSYNLLSLNMLTRTEIPTRIKFSGPVKCTHSTMKSMVSLINIIMIIGLTTTKICDILTTILKTSKSIFKD
jgi:hypothetical protein